MWLLTARRVFFFWLQLSLLHTPARLIDFLHDMGQLPVLDFNIFSF
jgi:hypothetical protein